MDVEGEETIQNEDVGSLNPSVVDEPVVDDTTIQDEDVTPEKQVLARDEMMTELARKRREELQERNNEEPVVETKDSDDEVVELKVNGEIIKKSKEEVESAGGVAKLQKELSAEAKLKKAAKERLALEEREEQQRIKEEALLEKERQLEERIARLEQKPKFEQIDIPEEELDSATDEFISNVYAGKEDEAKEALRKIVKANRIVQVTDKQEPVDSSSIVKQTVFEAERTLGRREFAHRYKDLMQDENLFAMTNRETARLMREKPDSSPYDIIMEAGENIEKWAKGVRGEESPDIVEEKVEKKRHIQNITAAKSRMQDISGYKQKTKEEIFAEYQKARPR